MTRAFGFDNIKVNDEIEHDQGAVKGYYQQLMPCMLGHDDSRPNLQIITGRWEMSSVTKRRCMVIPRKPLGWAICKNQNVPNLALRGPWAKIG